jgi:hypothetical protein
MIAATRGNLNPTCVQSKANVVWTYPKDQSTSNASPTPPQGKQNGQLQVESLAKAGKLHYVIAYMMTVSCFR